MELDDTAQTLTEAALRRTEELQLSQKSLQEKIAVVTAKKAALCHESSSLDARVAQLDSRCNAYSRELERMSTELHEESELTHNAVNEIQEMQPTQIQEAKCLQRGLTLPRAEGFRANVDTMADVMDKLGKAVVQRDQQLISKSKLEGIVKRSRQQNRRMQRERSDLRAALAFRSRKLSSSAALHSQLMQPPDAMPADPVSDEELEEALCDFEKKYMVLDEGASGLNETVRRMADEADAFRADAEEAELEADRAEQLRDHWRQITEQKQAKVAQLKAELVTVRESMSKIEVAVARKQQEIEAQVSAQRAELAVEKEQVSVELEASRATPEERVTTPPAASSELFPAASEGYVPTDGGPLGSPDSVAPRDSQTLTPDSAMAFIPGVADTPPPVLEAEEEEEEAAAEEEEAEVVVRRATYVKTGELLQLEVARLGSRQELRGHDVSSGSHYVLALEPVHFEQVDPEDPYEEFFNVVGLGGDPKQLMFPELVGSDLATMAPAGIEILLSIYQYDSRRFFASGFDEPEGRYVDLVMHESEEAGLLRPEHTELIDACGDNQGMLFNFFRGRLLLHESDGHRLRLELQ